MWGRHAVLRECSPMRFDIWKDNRPRGPPTDNAFFFTDTSAMNVRRTGLDLHDTREAVPLYIMPCSSTAGDCKGDPA